MIDIFICLDPHIFLNHKRYSYSDINKVDDLPFALIELIHDGIYKKKPQLIMLYDAHIKDDETTEEKHMTDSIIMVLEKRYLSRK